MAVSVGQFLVDYPEFEGIPQKMITAKIAMATLQVNSSVWGSKATDAIKVLAAHFLALSPLGEQSKLKHENRGTIYGDTFNMMKRQVTSGFRVI